MVLPKPAGAEMSVRGCLRLSESKPLRRGREIRVPEAVGIKNLVARSWLWMTIDVFMIAYPASTANIPFSLSINWSILCEDLLLGYSTIANRLCKAHERRSESACIKRRML